MNQWIKTNTPTLEGLLDEYLRGQFGDQYLFICFCIETIKTYGAIKTY